MLRMEFILDFQGFKNVSNEFIIKELAIVSTNEEINELYLFRPPYGFHQLPDRLKIQVYWLEKYFHGLDWSSGLKDFDEINDVLKNVFKLGGTVYVKGGEKCAFVRSLLSSLAVQVLNIEDIGCPSLQLLRQTFKLSNQKPCPFIHSADNCAYNNVHRILEWWKIDQLVLSRMEIVNQAIKDCFSYGYSKMSTDLVKYLPKDFIINYHEDVDIIFDKLPQKLKDDEDINSCKQCDKHFHWSNGLDSDCWDGKNLKRKHCYFCKQESLQLRRDENPTI